MEGEVITDDKSSGGGGGCSYRLLRFLREGGFGAVYQAQVIRGHHHEQEFVAIKAIQKERLCDEKLKTVKNEIRIQSRLSHPHVARLIHCFESEAHVFIVLEYFPGGDLEQRLSAPFPESEARNILAQLLHGVGYLHRNHILHRDLKLANVLVKTDVSSSTTSAQHQHQHQRVALCDFGLVVNVQASDNTRRTLCVTPISISPEVISQVTS